jgi:molybdopterin synthase sulfur carrier subunit
MTKVRVVLPAHLRTLARLDGEISVDVEIATVATVVDAIEADYPVLRGTIRDPATAKRRPFVRFFACNRDLSHEDVDASLPAAVLAGDESFLVVAAMAGG